MVSRSSLDELLVCLSFETKAKAKPGIDVQDFHDHSRIALRSIRLRQLR
jgi:hypothetical protein